METWYGSFWRKNPEIPENVKVLKRESEDDENEEEYQDSNDRSKSRGQGKRECPVPSCDSKVVHLPCSALVPSIRKLFQWRRLFHMTNLMYS